MVHRVLWFRKVDYRLCIGERASQTPQSRLRVGTGTTCGSVSHSDLGFSADDRTENVRRVFCVASVLVDAGLVAVVPIISPYERGRREARGLHERMELPFVEVFVDTPLEACE